MANNSLAARSAFLYSKPTSSPQLRIDFREDVTIASLAAAKGQADALRDLIRTTYGADLPASNKRTVGKGIEFVWAGPELWLAIADRGADRDLERELKALVGPMAAVVDHSDGRVIVRVSGPKARDVLVKGVPIDLHPRAFSTNSVAITHASHIGVILWQTADAPVYEIAMFRSFADSFMHWLDSSATEYIA